MLPCSHTDPTFTMIYYQESHVPGHANYYRQTYDWLECSMAERSPADLSEGMTPDELLIILQTEMDSIREDQQALKDEINAIKTQFCNMVHSCGFDDSSLSLTTSLASPKCATPRSSFGSPRQDIIPDEETPKPAKGGCSYGDKLIQMMLEMPSSYLDDSEISQSPPEQLSGNTEAEGTASSTTAPAQQNYHYHVQCVSSQVPKQVLLVPQMCQPMKLDFDAEANCTIGQSEFDTSYMPEIFDSDALLNCDSVRFNPASILNSTSISALDLLATSNSSSAVNCISASVNPVSRLDCTPAVINSTSRLDCTPAVINPAERVDYTSSVINPTSASNCIPATINPASELNYTPLLINPASTLNCTPSLINPSALNCTPAVINPASTLNCTPAVINSTSALNCTPAMINPALHLDCISAVIVPTSRLDCTPALVNPVSMLNCTTALKNPTSVLNSNPSVTNPVSAFNTTPVVVEPISERSRFMKANNVSECVNSVSTLNFTPAIENTSYNPVVLHSTPAVRHGTTAYMNMLNPKCSAIVNYSLSDTESEHSAVAPHERSAGVGNTSELPPNMDYQEEIMSRMKYYSDFTIDRQRKIDKMTSKLNLTMSPDYEATSPDVIPDDVFTRHVEGAEDTSHQVCLIGQPASRSGSLGSSSGGSSTLQKTAVSQHKDSKSSSSNNFTNRVLKSTENTRHLQRVPSHLTSTRRSVKASSTTSGNSTSPSTSSVYAWSIQGSNDGNEDCYLKATRSNSHRRSQRGDKRPRSSRNSVQSQQSSHSSSKALHCRDHDIHTMLGQPCHQVMKYLPIPQYYTNDFILSNDSLYDDGYKSQTLPRSSTKKSSCNPSSSRNSSLEVKRNSVADIRAVKTPPHSEHHISSGSDSITSKYPPGRPGCIGMSTTSGSQDSPTGTDSSIPRSRDPTSSLSTEAENNAQTALTDSILTDSPNSVSSSGIFAPCNSPDAIVGSRVSISTIGDSQSIDLRGISVIQSNTTTLSGLSAIHASSMSSSQFKVPKAPPPKRSSRRRGGDRCSTPDVRTSTPKPQSYPNSVQSDQVSRRKLFSSSSSTHSSQGSSSRLLDKKSVLKKFRKFSENFYKTKSGRLQIETLANL